jgi:hypothetical protein
MLDDYIHTDIPPGMTCAEYRRLRARERAASAPGIRRLGRALRRPARRPSAA